VTRKPPDPPGLAVGWKWLAGTAVTVLILGGGAWMGIVWSEVSTLKREVAEKGGDVREIKKDIEAIKESQKSQLDLIRDAQKDQRRQQDKVDDKLEKLKELLQDEKFRSRPRAN